jgi:hypothetical protein
VVCLKEALIRLVRQARDWTRYSEEAKPIVGYSSVVCEFVRTLIKLVLPDESRPRNRIMKGLAGTREHGKQDMLKVGE